MFPTPSKVTRLWLLPTVALTLMLLVYAVFAFNSAKAQPSGTPPGDYCVEGIVINWKEEPLAGWTITLTGSTFLTATQYVSTTTSAEEPDEDDKDPDFQKGEFAFKDIPEEPGTYTATITLKPGWGGVTATSFTFDINEGEDDCVQIRFKVAPQIPVTVYKIDANHDPLEDWKIKVVPGPGNLFASPDEDTTDISGTVVFTLTPGLWYFMEMPPKTDEGDPQEAYMPVVPPSGRQQLDVKEEDWDQGLTVVFKNELVVGCVLVQKVSEPATDGVTPQLVDPTTGFFKVAGWGIKLLRKDGTVARQGETDAKGQIRFDGLPLGPYIIVEDDRPGWDPVTGNLTEQEVNVTGNDCTEPFIFRNQQDINAYCIEGRKIDANGGYGIPDWEIKIKPLADEGYDPADVFTDGLGKFRFDFPKNDYRVPGAEYEICEEDKDGWLPHTATCQTVQLPEWPGACVQMTDFVNQQVGHSESEKMGGMWGGPMDGGPSMDGGMGMSCSSYYIAKPGEGLYDIGRMFNKSAQEMLNANPDIKNSAHQWVIIGQKVCIP